uniref:uncharacterized protein LOC113473988 isoform X2 n=1 Tax=Ciona intestinalis TaxID=7719 RepID=UPI00089DD277|nr:uncharacterized protein LOC113473988 isoform X2 [Ciona intestinalis]|eukprot:XP_018673307.1 uncharacterized protein LOC113473988 isoform X2 [Ciona intestinalis]
MESKGGQRRALFSLQNLAGSIDTNIPLLEERSRSRFSCTKSAESLTELKNVANEFKSVKNECKKQLTNQKIDESVMGQMLVCSRESLKLAQTICDQLSNKLSSRGYVPPQNPTTEFTNSQSDEDIKVLPSSNECNAVAVESNAVTTDNSAPEENKKRTCTMSPQQPLLLRGDQGKNGWRSPSLPNLCLNNGNGDGAPAKPQMFFDSIASPEQPKLNEVSVAMTKNFAEEKENENKFVKPQTYFNSIATPETPRLKDFTKYHPAATPDQEKFVLYSRKSLGNYAEQYQSPDTPDITINHMNTKKNVTKSSDAAYADSPDMQGLARLNLLLPETSKFFQHLRYNEKPVIESPVMPDFSVSQLQGRDSNSSCRRSSDWIDPEQFEELPPDTKRLFSLELVNSALDSIRIHMKTTGAQRLSAKNIEEATGLGGKTKSCLLVLTSLKLVHKIPGTQLYEVDM